MAEKKTTAKTEAKPLVKVERKSVLLSARSTEKAALAQNKQNIYVFNVAKDATKASIKACLKLEYKVVPVDVRILAIPAKPTLFRGRKGSKSKGKKAYVYLKKGDTIAI
jgi:large subunit ribosomal protein L23